MRVFGLVALAAALISCGEIDDNSPCTTSMDCDAGYVCLKDGDAEGVCKLRRAEPCVRPAECSSGVCSSGFCE